MKKLQLLVIMIALSLGVNAQVWIDKDVFTPASFDTVDVSNMGGNEIVHSKILVIRFDPSFNPDSILIGKYVIDSTQVAIQDYTGRCIMDKDNTKIVVNNGYNFNTTDKDIIIEWMRHVYMPYIKARSRQSMIDNYQPHKY